jgi:hypothetical protein
MRITLDLPDELLRQAESLGGSFGAPPEQILVEAIADGLQHLRARDRREPPAIGSLDAPLIHVLTVEQIDEALFG